jgi:clan AA aspartic protease (TIGR02281 family)
MIKQWVFLCCAGLFFLWPGNSASADIIYLRNGRHIEGVVKQETESSIELQVSIGTIKLRRDEILRIETGQANDNENMLQEWDKQRENQARENKLRQESERKQKLEEQDKKSRTKSIKPSVQASGHMTVSAKLNDSVSATLMVDTGATTIVLSKKIGDQLGLTGPNTEGQKDGEMQVADGRKVKAKFVVLKSVVVQEVEGNDISAAIMLDDKADMGFDGVLGMSFLKQFNFGFDNKEGKLTLEKLK